MGNFVDHNFLEAQSLAMILQYVSPLTMAALSCNSLLHYLRYPTKYLINNILRLLNSAKDMVRFPNWLFTISTLIAGFLSTGGQ